MCDTPIIPGTSLKSRYAVLVSFGVLLNGTDLDDVASKVPPELDATMCTHEVLDVQRSSDDRLTAVLPCWESSSIS